MEIEIICWFARHHVRRMELANILCELLRNPGKGTLGCWNPKSLPVVHTPDPPRSCHLWLLFGKLVSSYTRSTPGIEYIFGKYIWLNKPAEILPRNFPVTFILMWNLPCQHRSLSQQRERDPLKKQFSCGFILLSNEETSLALWP